MIICRELRGNNRGSPFGITRNCFLKMKIQHLFRLRDQNSAASGIIPIKTFRQKQTTLAMPFKLLPEIQENDEPHLHDMISLDLSHLLMIQIGFVLIYLFGLLESLCKLESFHFGLEFDLDITQLLDKIRGVLRRLKCS